MNSKLILIPLLSILAILITFTVLQYHDTQIIEAEGYDIFYNSYMNAEYYTCESLAEEIEYYDKFFLRTPDDSLVNAYHDRCIEEEK